MSSVPFTLAEIHLRERSLSQSTRWVKAAQLTAAAFVLPQVSTVLWWIQTHSWIHVRGFVNIEYLALFAVALLFPNWGTIAALTAELTIALVEPLAHLYYFSPADALRSFRYLALVPTHVLLGYSLFVLVYIGGCALFLRSALGGVARLSSRRIAIVVMAALLCLWSYDLLTGHLRPLHTSVNHGDVDLHTTRLVRSPVASLVYATFLLRHGAPISGHAGVESALARAMSEVEPGTQPNVVLVLTESWGLAVDKPINAAEVAPYMTPQIEQAYRVETGTVKFYGSTTSGETRELCGDAVGRWGDSDGARRYASCWPAQFDRRGYATVAVHGFTPTMYDRESWYPEFGFSEQDFLPTLQSDGARMCNGAFPGVCDTDVAKWIGNRLEHEPAGRPAFVHWVTLNSHLPVAEVTGLEADTNCHSAGIDDHGSLCAWFNRVLDVHKGVAEMAERALVRPTVFVIVGDHAPPFLRPQTRNRFSQSEVPWVILMPRSTAVPRSLAAAEAHDTPSTSTLPANKHLHHARIRIAMSRTAG